MHAKINKETVLSLLCCGQQHKQTDEAVLQSAEVLRREETGDRKCDHHRHKNPQTYITHTNYCQTLKGQRTGSEVFGEKRQKPEVRQQHTVTENTAPSKHTFSIKEATRDETG